MILYNVVGIDDLEGLVFAQCTTPEKALKAFMLLEYEGYEGMLRIVKEKITVDEIIIDNEVVEL